MVMGLIASEKPHRRRPKLVTYSFLHFPWWLVTAHTDPLTEKDKENAQQKKMECLQAKNAKMKKKLKASMSAKGQTQYSVWPISTDTSLFQPLLRILNRKMILKVKMKILLSSRIR
jgi:hypothetical protein